MDDLDRLPSRKTRKKSIIVRKLEMRFNVNKCRILKVDTKTKNFHYEMYSVKTESTQWVKDFGVAIAFNLKFCQQCKHAAGKTYRILGFINRNFSFIDKDIILSLHNSLFRSHLEFYMQSRYPPPPPRQTKDMAKLAVQWRATKMISSLCNKSFEERLASLDLVSREVAAQR